MLKSKEKEANMPQKTVVSVLVIICLTILIFTLIMRKSLCEINIKNGALEVAAKMAYETMR